VSAYVRACVRDSAFAVKHSPPEVRGSPYKSIGRGWSQSSTTRQSDMCASGRNRERERERQREGGEREEGSDAAARLFRASQAELLEKKKGAAGIKDRYHVAAIISPDKGSTDKGTFVIVRWLPGRVGLTTSVGQTNSAARLSPPRIPRGRRLARVAAPLIRTPMLRVLISPHHRVSRSRSSGHRQEVKISRRRGAGPRRGGEGGRSREPA
jgi:hypothetical protein